MQRLVNRGGVAIAQDKRPGFIGIERIAERADDGARFRWIELDGHLDRAAWIERRAGAIRQPFTVERGGMARGTVASDELGAIAGHRAIRASLEANSVEIEERLPLGELLAERVAREQRAGGLVS